MRQASGGRRPRNRHHNNGGNAGNGGNGGNNGNGGGNRPRSAASLRYQNFDSNCGDVRVRGNAWQVHEKYQALARDAASSGDRVAEQNYLQHAEHFFRIIEAINEATAAEQASRPPMMQQQPEMPAGYFGGQSGVAGQPQAPDSISNAGQPHLSPAQMMQGQPQPMPEAQVERRQPQSPFFTQDDVDEEGQPQSLVAQR